jgi:hypothetical protein
MTAIALVFSLLVAALGALGLVSPSRLLSVDRYFQTPGGLYFAAAVRLVMGAAFFFAAPDSSAPKVLRILGAVVIVAGVITLFFGLERFRGLIDWWLAHRSAFVRPFAAFALVLGILLTYALVT